MFTKYASVASPAAANFGSDIVALLTGETDKNNLSIDNLPGGTEITSVHPAGWTVWDSDTGTSDEWILRAPCDGDATQFKYLRIRFYISTYMRIEVSLMEDWDAGSNTPTNACTQTEFLAFRIPVTSWGDNSQILNIFATNRYIVFRSTGYSNLNSTFFPVVEITRLHPCLEVGSGYLPAVQTTDTWYTADNLTTYRAKIPRIIDDAGTADLTNQDLRALTTSSRPNTMDTNTEFDSISLDRGFNLAGTAFYGIHLIQWERRELIGGILGTSELAKIWIMQGGVDALFDDESLHTLDTTDDLRLFWMEDDTVLNGSDPRVLFQAE